MRVTERQFCDESRGQPRTGFGSSQQVGQAGAGDQGGRVRGRAHRSGQNHCESRPITSTNHASTPPRSAAPTLTEMLARGWSRLGESNPGPRITNTPDTGPRLLTPAICAGLHRHVGTPCTPGTSGACRSGHESGRQAGCRAGAIPISNLIPSSGASTSTTRGVGRPC
jgi:hypothetical protein